MDWMTERKGEPTEIVTFMFWLFVMAIGIVLLVFVFNEFFSILPETILYEDNATRQAIDASTAIIVGSLPTTYFIIFFGLLLGLLVSSFLIRTHPVFIPVYILVAMMTILAAVALGNAWGNIKDIESFQTTLELNTVLSAIDLIISNIVLVVLVAFITSIIIIFAKPGGSGGGQGGAAPF